MITDQEKIEIIINRLNNIKAMHNSFIENEKAASGKYILKDELLICDEKKQVLLNELKKLGGSWIDSNN